jgi:hypothetical protein
MHSSFREGFEKSATVGSFLLNNSRTGGALVHGVPAAAAAGLVGAGVGALTAPEGQAGQYAAIGGIGSAVGSGLAAGTMGALRGNKVRKVINATLGPKARIVDARVGDAADILLHPHGVKVPLLAGALGGAAGGATVGLMGRN